MDWALLEALEGSAGDAMVKYMIIAHYSQLRLVIRVLRGSCSLSAVPWASVCCTWYSGDNKAILELMQPKDLYMQLRQGLSEFAKNMAGTGTSNRIRESRAQSYYSHVGHFNRDLAMPRHSPRHESGPRLYRRSEPKMKPRQDIYT